MIELLLSAIEGIWR